VRYEQRNIVRSERCVMGSSNAEVAARYDKQATTAPPL